MLHLVSEMVIHNKGFLFQGRSIRIERIALASWALLEQPNLKHFRYSNVWVVADKETRTPSQRSHPCLAYSHYLQYYQYSTCNKIDSERTLCLFFPKYILCLFFSSKKHFKYLISIKNYLSHI